MALSWHGTNMKYIIAFFCTVTRHIQWHGEEFAWSLNFWGGLKETFGSCNNYKLPSPLLGFCTGVGWVWVCPWGSSRWAQGWDEGMDGSAVPCDAARAWPLLLLLWGGLWADCCHHLVPEWATAGWACWGQPWAPLGDTALRGAARGSWAHSRPAPRQPQQQH